VHPIYRHTCRICGSPNLTPTVDLGEQYLQGSFAKEGLVKPPMRRLPTQLVRCDVTLNERGCGLLQLAHSFPPEILYANYWYRSGTNATMRDHLAGVVDSVLREIKIKHPTVLDIGCNDGTLLKNYPKGSTLFGIDPSDIASEISSDVTVINTVFPSPQAASTLPKGGLDAVTSIAMFYDLEDPVEFARAITSVLQPDGIWVFEMSYLPLMLLQNSFDTICHEHLEYYSLTVIEQIAKMASLRIFKAEINDINGGSIRCYACHASNSGYGSSEDRKFLSKLRINEFELELDTEKPYLAFKASIEKSKQELTKALYDARARGERIHVYGASTKGNVLLQWYGINRVIVDAAADRNPQKVGSKTLGTDIPIISEEASRALKPDYYLVLPWHFKREFLEREREAILSGVKMIFPLPEVSIVGTENYEQALASTDDSLSRIKRLLFDR
jgi:hypothetical protein